MARTKKTRNAGTLTEAAYWAKVRSILRRGFRYWKPIINTKLEARREYKGEEKRRKWEYQCAECKQWFPEKEVEVDHQIPVGSLKSGKDLEGFLERLTAEGGYQLLCKPCHLKKTIRERKDE